MNTYKIHITKNTYFLCMRAKSYVGFRSIFILRARKELYARWFKLAYFNTRRPILYDVHA